jgi:hypothetical protein
MRLEIKDFIGTRCITSDDGQRIFDAIYPSLHKGEQTILNFEGVTIFASPFFNFAIGQLLKDLDPDKLNKLLKIENLLPESNLVLRRVIKNAWEYYTKPNTKEAIDDILKKQAEKD